MTTAELINAFTKAVNNYSSSSLRMFEEEADRLASQLINQHGVDPEQLDDIWFSIIPD